MICKILKVFYVFFALLVFKQNSLKSVLFHPHKFFTDNVIGF